MSDSKYAQLVESTSQMWSDALFQDEKLLSELDLLDSEVKEILRQVGLQICEKVSNKLAAQVTDQAKEPGLWVKRAPNVTYYTLFGPIQVRSPYLYNDKTGKSKNPTRHALLIEGKGRSLALERALADFGVEESFERAAARFCEHYGWEMSPSIIRLVTYEHAHAAESWIEEKLEEESKAYEVPVAYREGVEELLIELDGCLIRSCELQELNTKELTEKRKLPKRRRQIEYKEVRVGLCRELTKDEKKYVGARGSYEKVCKQLFDVSVMEGLSTKTQVIGVSDRWREWVGKRIGSSICGNAVHFRQATL